MAGAITRKTASGPMVGTTVPASEPMAEALTLKAASEPRAEAQPQKPPRSHVGELPEPIGPGLPAGTIFLGAYFLALFPIDSALV